MARYGPADVTVTYSAQLLADVTVIGDIPKEAITEEITPFGQAWEQHANVGVSRMGEITLEAPYSDDQNLLRDKLDDVGIGGTATLLLAFGGTKTLSVSTILKSVTRNLSRGALSKVSAVLQPTGIPTEV